MLIKQRKQELKHAMEVKELFEKKLEKVNDLFMELNAWKLQLEEEERNLQRRKKQFNVPKVYNKKKLRPLTKNFSSEGRSTSPEFKSGGATAKKPQVRVNPMYQQNEVCGLDSTQNPPSSSSTSFTRPRVRTPKLAQKTH